MTEDSDMWAETIRVSSVSALGNALGRRREQLHLTQQKLGKTASVRAQSISLLEHQFGDYENMPVSDIIRLADALELDLELRPRGSRFTPRRPTKVVELNLSPQTMAALTSAGIERIAQLGSATSLLQLPAFAGGAELHELVCALNRHGISLPTNRSRSVIPSDRDREIFRLRVVDGLTLTELARRFDLHNERVRQILSVHFGLTGVPPNRKPRRRAAQTCLA